jgi:hypothetical protein
MGRILLHVNLFSDSTLIIDGIPLGSLWEYSCLAHVIKVHFDVLKMGCAEQLYP